MIDDPASLITAIRAAENGSDMPAAVVFNCHITGLAVARSLGMRGVPVIGLDAIRKVTACIPGIRPSRGVVLIRLMMSARSLSC